MLQNILINYNFYIILTIMLIISLCNKNIYSKKCLKFLCISLPIIFLWNIVVMITTDLHPWIYPHDIGIYFYCYTQDILFFPIVTLFGYVLINFCKNDYILSTKSNNYITFIFYILIILSVNDFFSYTICLFFVLPAYYFFNSCKYITINLPKLIVISFPIILMWDFYSTSIKVYIFHIYSWKYMNLEIYNGWLFNSPTSAIYLGFVGIVFIFSVYVILD